jgi:uncharacterized membrane protein YcaP (DUF421 family)
MWNLSLPWWEFVLRAVIVYGFLIVILRLTGKRQIGQMSPFDLVLLLVLSNAVQNAMNGGDNTVAGGLILATTLIAFNALVSFLTARDPRMEKWLVGEPAIIVYDGEVVQETLDREAISMAELEGAIREAGCADFKDVRMATLEINGQISIVRDDKSGAGKPRLHRSKKSLKRKGASKSSHA